MNIAELINADHYQRKILDRKSGHNFLDIKYKFPLDQKHPAMLIKHSKPNSTSITIVEEQ